MSTNINQLPNMNQQSNMDDDDDAIQEVLAEIHNEQNPQIMNEPPSIPMEAMQQLPPQPKECRIFCKSLERVTNNYLEV